MLFRRKMNLILLFHVSIFIYCIIGISGQPSHTPQGSESSAHSGASSKKKTLTDLNDDILHEMYNEHLDVCELANLFDTSRRMITVDRAYALFKKKVLEAIQKYHLDVIDKKKKPEELYIDMLKLIVACTPINKETGLHKFVLLWKVVVAIEIIGVPQNNLAGVVPHYAIISNSIKVYVGNILNESGSETFGEGKVITVGDHQLILMYLLSVSHKPEYGRLCIAYIRLLQKTKAYLKGKYTYWMIFAAKKVETGANTEVVITSIFDLKRNQEFNYKQIFLLDWTLYKGKASDEVKDKINLIVAKKAIEDLHENYYQNDLSPAIVRHFAYVYCAIRQLIGSKSKHLVDASGFSMTVFDLEEKHNTVIKRLHKSLQKELQGTKTHAGDIKTRAAELNKLIQNKKTVDEHNYKSILNDLMFEEEPETDSYVGLIEAAFDESVKKLKDAKDFKLYIELLKTAKPLIDFLPINIQKDIHNAYFLFADRKAAFDNETQLLEVDKLHVEVFESISVTSSLKYITPPSKDYRKQFDNLFKNFKSIIAPTDKDKKASPLKQRVILKFTVALADGGFGKLTSQDLTTYRVGDSATIHNQLKQIVKLFFDVAYSKDVNLMQDSSLSREWGLFNDNVMDEIKNLYIQRGEQQNIFVRSASSSVNKPIVYLSLLRLAKRYIETSVPIPENVLKYILSLEKVVGDGETTESFISVQIITDKFTFHHGHRDAILQLQQQNDLKGLVASSLDLIYDRGLTCAKKNMPRNEAFQMFMRAVGATKNAIAAKVNVKSKLGPELIERIDDMFYFYNYNRFEDLRDVTIPEYAQLKNTLAFATNDTVQNP